MNNSKIALENEEVLVEKERDNKPFLRQKEGELVKIIEAINGVKETNDWIILRNHVFDGLVEGLERRLSSEAGKSELNQPEIHRLQGQLVWARKYSDFDKLADVFRSELLQVKKALGTESH